MADGSKKGGAGAPKKLAEMSWSFAEHLPDLPSDMAGAIEVPDWMQPEMAAALIGWQRH